MQVLITGAAGCLGRGIIRPFEEHGHALRLMDVADFEHPEHEVVVGDVSDLATVRRAVRGVDALVIGHMASRQAGAYQTPGVPFDANVKGTANLLFAAVEHGIGRVVLISTPGAILGYHGLKEAEFFGRDLPIGGGRGIYGLTKACQELIARHYHTVHGVRCAVLRVGCIVEVDGRTVTDKYGRTHRERGLALVSNEDIGEVARLALELPDLAWEVFYAIGTPEAPRKYDVAYTRERLGWTPRHDFTWMPPDPRASQDAENG